MKESTRVYVSRYVSEDEDFWQSHLTQFKASGLTRKQYCQANGVDYNRFNYWKQKFLCTSSKPLIPSPKGKSFPSFLSVQIKPDKTNVPTSPLSMKFANGCIIHIHTVEGLSMVLEKVQ